MLAEIRAAEIALTGSGRLLIRESGTEPLVRVMAESEDEALVHRLVDGLCETIAAVARIGDPPSFESARGHAETPDFGEVGEFGEIKGFEEMPGQS